MTDTTAQEPTMEEILASIRRIISEDEAPPATPAAAVPEPEPEPEPEPDPEPATAAVPATEPEVDLAEDEAGAASDEEEILDLTERYEAPASESIGDLDVSGPSDEPEPFPAASESPQPAPTLPTSAPEPDEALVGETAAASAASAFAGLAASFRTPDPIPTGGTGPTIDDLARALLRPMLKEWLDAHLPGIVEAAVKKEVERIARLA